MAAVTRAILCIAVSAASCQRAPPEPAPPPPQVTVDPAPPTSMSPEAAPPRAAPRCVRATPAQPPPAVSPGPDPACPRDPSGGPPMVPVGHVAFGDAAKAPKLEVELMLDEERQERGLMYRKKLADDRGMLFVFGAPSIHTFWMHNTCLPLDMLFIDDAGFIAGIVENAPTLNDDGRSVDCPVSYVLEVNAGWSRRYGVKAGQRVQIEGVPRR